MTMIRVFPLLALVAAPALAAPGGPIGTLPLGAYVCELPGDAAGPAGVRVPEQDFTVANASSYVAAGQRGSYLLTGDLVAMTSGPKAGQRFRKLGGGFLRSVESGGANGSLRCVRQVVNNR
ncbi:MAG: hypothetical protein ACREBO_14505 [Novosphingobium sp.]